MKVREMRELGSDDLTNKIDETRKEIVKLRFDMAMRKLESPAKLRNARRELAQMLTIKTEQAKGKDAKPKSAKPSQSTKPSKAADSGKSAAAGTTAKAKKPAAKAAASAS